MNTGLPPAEWHPSPRLHALPGYGRGRAARATDFRHRLGSNEAPDTESGARADALGAAMENLNRYPDLRGETLVAAIAERHGLDTDKVAVAAGSIVLLDQLVRASCDPGDEIVAPWPSYEAYPIIAGLSGARLVRVPLDKADGADPQAILEQIGKRCRVVLICNPNNPTSTALDDETVDRLLERIPQDRLIILDEAYTDYASGATATRPAQRLARHSNLAVLRTFSKAWGLAGARVGYCLAAQRIIAAVHAVAPPFPVPSLSAAAALAALRDPGFVAMRVQSNDGERRRLTDGLRALDLPVAESKANFVWLPVGLDARPLSDHFARASIAVRCFENQGVRITTGSSADTEAVLEAAKAWRR